MKKKLSYSPVKRINRHCVNDSTFTEHNNEVEFSYSTQSNTSFTLSWYGKNQNVKNSKLQTFFRRLFLTLTFDKNDPIEDFVNERMF